MVRDQLGSFLKEAIQHPHPIIISSYNFLKLFLALLSNQRSGPSVTNIGEEMRKKSDLMVLFQLCFYTLWGSRGKTSALLTNFTIIFLKGLGSKLTESYKKDSLHNYKKSVITLIRFYCQFQNCTIQ